MVFFMVLRTYWNSFLLPDLASDMGTGPEVDWPEVMGQATQAAAVSYSLCILADDVARAEVGDDACSEEYDPVNSPLMNSLLIC